MSLNSHSSIEWTDRSWNPVPSAPGYEVSVTGLLRNAKTQRILKPQRNGNYLYVMLRLNGRNCKPVKVWMHRAVLEAFVGPCPSGMECRHLDDDSGNNNLANLAWGTRLENVADKYRNDRIPTGERSGSAKLTAADVLAIRKRVKSETLRSLAREFGVSHTAIRRAANGTKWSHLQTSLNDNMIADDLRIREFPVGENE